MARNWFRRSHRIAAYRRLAKPVRTVVYDRTNRESYLKHHDPNLLGSLEKQTRQGELLQIHVR